MNSLDRRFYDLADGRMSALHFNAGAGVPRVVFAHANGFNALTYRQVLEPLGVHVIALDLRGHGMSELPIWPRKLQSFHVFANDIVAFADRYLEGSFVLAGHSFGAVSAILAAPQLKSRLDGYVGFDPVTLPYLPRLIPYVPGGRAFMRNLFPIAKNAGKRRRNFESIDEAYDRYRGRGAFKFVDDTVLRDYLEGGLKPASEGFELACHPRWEQAIYGAQGHNIYKAAKSLPARSQIIYAGKSQVSDRFTRARIGRMIGSENVRFMPELHHLFPLNKPIWASERIQEVLAKRANPA